MYKQFAVCIAVSIAISAICALSLSPAMCSHILGHDKPQGKLPFDAKHAFGSHLARIKERINKRTARIVESFNKCFPYILLGFLHMCTSSTTIISNIFFVVLLVKHFIMLSERSVSILVITKNSWVR